MIWFLLILLALAFAAPFVLERMRPEMDSIARKAASGQLALLSDGETHYQWHGPADGPVLVCVHGLTTPSYIFNLLVPSLAEAGFRVLTYDLFGRGFSDRPKGAQTRAFFIRQLRELLQDQNVGGGITLLGYSMGGSIATVFTAAEPDRVERLLLLAPAGMKHTPGKLALFVQKVPGLGDWLMLALGGWQLRRGAVAQPGPAEVIAEFADRQALEVGFRGYLPAVLSSQRNILAEPLEADHRDLAALGVPVGAVWGQDDTVIPIAAMGKLTEWNRGARQAVVPGAGHGLAISHASEVIESLATVLEA